MNKTTTVLLILGLLLAGASALLAKDAYARNQVKSKVFVYAAGYASDNKEYPTMELSLNNSTVCQWKNIKNSDVDKTYTGKYECEILHQKVTENTDVRVLYINASLDPKITRKLVVDKIEVDGVPYETESCDTYTYKTRPLQSWCENQDGYLETEETVCNGYFQYKMNASPTPAPTPMPTPIPNPPFGGGWYTNLCGGPIPPTSYASYSCSADCSPENGYCTGHLVRKYVCEGELAECNMGTHGFKWFSSTTNGTERLISSKQPLKCNQTEELEVRDRKDNVTGYMVWYTGVCPTPTTPPCLTAGDGSSCE